MPPHHSYRNRAAAGWTRIDMLIEIYDAAITHIADAVQAAAEAAPSRMTPTARLRAQKLLLLLLEGLDTRTDTAAREIERLLSFCLRLVTDGDAADCGAVLRILTRLRDGFVDIRDEARELEAAGTIPPMDWSSHALTLARA